MTTKKAFLESLVTTDTKISKIISWSLKSVPDRLLTSSTIVLLPSMTSPEYIERAKQIGYAPENVETSYDRCNPDNLKLFPGAISRSVIFLSDGRCIDAEYLNNENGDHSPIRIIDDSVEITSMVQWFDSIWDSSSRL